MGKLSPDRTVPATVEMLRESATATELKTLTPAFSEAGNAGEPPECLIDYFPKDWMLVLDESHVTVPQFAGCTLQQRSSA
jgi:excinuclease ABC subunit B